MAVNKTQATQASAAAHLAAIADEGRRADCQTLADLIERTTGHPPTMWGPSIVGFGRYGYRYESGRTGEMCETGFASRKGDIVVYLQGSFPGRDALLERLGRHKAGGACLHIRRLADVDLDVLAQLVRDSAAEVRRRHGA